MQKPIIAGALLAIGFIIAWELFQSTETGSFDDGEMNEERKLIHLSSDQIDHFGIEISDAQPGLLSLNLATRGKIIFHPDHLAHILPKVSGVAKVAYKNIGDHVAQGEVLAALESREMAEIKAGYLAAIEKEKLAYALLQREQSLNEKKISAEQDYLQAKTDYEEARISKQLAEQKLHAFGLRADEITRLANLYDPELCLYEIRSPLEGTIINRHITQGEFIEDTMTIYEVANLNNVWIEIGIYPKDLPKVRVGQLVHVKLPLEEIDAQARLIYVSPMIEDETITAKAVAEMDNLHGKWRPGSFVQVRIATDEFPADIVISKDAIQEIEGESVVFVRVNDGFEKRAIQVGKSDAHRTEVVGGLHLGEHYAIANTFLLKAELGKHDVEHDH